MNIIPAGVPIGSREPTHCNIPAITGHPIIDFKEDVHLNVFSWAWPMFGKLRSHNIACAAIHWNAPQIRSLTDIELICTPKIACDSRTITS